MSEVADTIEDTERLRVLAESVGGLDLLDELSLKLRPGSTLSLGGLWGSTQALALARLAARSERTWIALVSTDVEARVLSDDLAIFGADRALLPSSGSDPKRPEVEALRQRMEVGRRLAQGDVPKILVASLQGIYTPLASIEQMERDLISLRVGEELDISRLQDRLAGRGHTRQPLVERPGEFSVRGDVLDLWLHASAEPLRIELFDEEIESLRSFDPENQRSTQTHAEIEVCMTDAGSREDDGVLPFKLAKKDACLVDVEPLRLEDHAQTLRVQTPDYGKAHMQLEAWAKERPRVSLQSLPGDDHTLQTFSVQGLSVGTKAAPGVLVEELERGGRVVVLCQNEAERHRFAKVVEESGGVPGLELGVGNLGRGFRLPAPSDGLLIVNHRELVGLIGRQKSKAHKRTHGTRALRSFFELKIGDLVVHAVHGLARFEGLARLERGGGEEEHLHLVFADDVSLYVPAARIDVVQRYIGSGSAPTLDKIGGQTFRKRKERVQKALVDLASDLLEVQARRETERRKPWKTDPELLADLLGSFPYEDTPDQAKTDAELAKDLSSDKVMDRLLCGDVGFGKTEIAVRAAFRVVSGGGQVAILVPTTVLAQQHFETFCERYADFPVTVGVISRYSKPADARRLLEEAGEGKVDVLIGTHRILSKDVDLPKLGLLIIDEEQRFGVTHKEHFKALRAKVDVLTLTATPIPRTLHMSISGVRDISALTVPPTGRKEIATKLGYLQDTEAVREAILRERNRGGQVFVLHNRVKTIEAAAQELAALVPECSFAIGHGQMSGGELREIMETFVRGEVDVLVATTIIESGIDIPAAGTIIVQRANMFGLSELHQLRGRVARAGQSGYCHLLVDKHKPLRQAARDRLKALEELSQLGAGFAISMKDLEIRGAGNILGPEQSGHISAVGYDLYCRLLRGTIDRIQEGVNLEDLAKAELLDPGVDLLLGLDAYLPEEWEPDAERRLELLRELSSVQDTSDREAAEAMLSDRFGRIPDEVLNILRTYELRARLEAHGVTGLSWKEDRYQLEYTDRVSIEAWIGPTNAELRPIRHGLAHLMVPENIEGPTSALSWLETLLGESSSAEGTGEVSDA